MAAECAWRSTNLDVVRAWREWHARAEKWRLDCIAFADAVGPGREPMGGTSWGDRSLEGVTHEPGQPVPAGWRLVKGRRGFDPYIVPLRNTKGRRALSDAMRALRLPVLKLPGMPERIWDGNTRYYPSGGLYDGAVYIAWDITAELVPTETGRFGEDPFDASLWTPVKLSEFYAAQEAREAQEREESTCR